MAHPSAVHRHHRRRWLVAWLVVTAVAAVGVPSAFAASTVYVAPTGTDSVTCGTTVGTPCMTVSYTVNNRLAAVGDTVSLAPGTYLDAISTTKSFTITGAAQSESLLTCAAAQIMQLSGSATVTLQHLSITQCDKVSASLGTVYLTGTAALTLQDVAITSSSSTLGGGAIAAQGRATVTVFNSVFSNNTAMNGAVVYLSDQARATFTNSRFTSNGVLAGNSRGGVLQANDMSAASFVNCQILDAVSQLSGGAFALSGSASLTVTDTTVTRCMVSNGRGVWLSSQGNSSVTLAGSVFLDGACFYGDCQSSLLFEPTLRTFSTISVVNCTFGQPTLTRMTPQHLFAIDATPNLGGVYTSLPTVVLSVRNSTFSEARSDFFYLAGLKLTGTIAQSTFNAGRALTMLQVNSPQLLISSPVASDFQFRDGGGFLQITNDVGIPASIVMTGGQFTDLGAVITTKQSYGGVIFLSGTNVTLVASGLKIQSSQLAMGAAGGGAVAIANGASATISSSFITNMMANFGGAIWLGPLQVPWALTGAHTEYDGASVTLNGVTVQSCSAAQNGGAIYVATGAVLEQPRSTVKVSNSQFSGITAMSTVRAAGLGGVAYLGVATTASFSSVVMEKSNSSNGGGALYVAAKSFVQLVGCQIRATGANYTGGAIMATATAAVSVSGTTFSQCYSKNGGSLYADTSASMSVYGSKFLSSGAQIGGSVSLLQTANMKFQRCVFKGSTALKSGGTFSATAASATSKVDLLVQDTWISQSTCSAGNGGAFYISVSSFVSLQNVTMIAPSAKVAGGGLYVDSTTTVVMNTVYLSQAKSYGGGGLFCAASANVTGSYVRFMSGTSNVGAAIAMAGISVVTLWDTTFDGNKATAVGGAVYIDGESRTHLTRMQAVSSSAAEGGFAYATAFAQLQVSQATITNSVAQRVGGVLSAVGMSNANFDKCRLSNNQALAADGNGGGGVFNMDTSAVVVVQGSLLSGNRSPGGAGGIAMLSFGSSITLDRCVLSGNTAVFGGGIQVADNSFVYLQNSVVSGNDAQGSAIVTTPGQGQGGAIQADDGANVVVRNTVFQSNKAAVHGGAVAIVGPQVVVNLQNVTFNQNSAVKNGGAVYIIAGPAPGVTLRMNVVSMWSNSANYGAAVMVSSAASCAYAPWSAVRFVNNHASEAGGALYYDVASLALATCPCVSCVKQGNTAAGYGATDATMVSEIIAKPSLVSRAVSGQSLPVPIVVEGRDVFHNRIRVLQTRIVVRVAPAPSSAAVTLVSGTTVVTGNATQQQLVFNGLRVTAPPGSEQSLVFSAVFPEDIAECNVTIQVLPCSRGQKLEPLSSVCVPCPADQYSFEAGASACNECPTAAYCPGGGKLWVRQGFWRANENDSHVIRCLNPKACVGYNGTVADRVVTGCAPGYTGNLCFNCALGYGRSGQSECDGCPPPAINRLLISLFVIVAAAFMYGLIYTTRKSAAEKKDSYMMMLKVLTSYLQFVSLAAGLQIDWPTELLQFFAIQSGATSSSDRVISLDCLLREPDSAPGSVFFRIILVYLLLPLVGMAVIGLFWFVRYFFGKHKAVAGTREAKKRRQDYIDATIVSCIVWGFFLHPTLTQQAFSIFTCRPLDTTVAASNSTVTYLDQDLDFQCWSPTHMAWFAGAGIPALLVYVLGIPCGALFVLWRARNQLQAPHIRSKYGFLYSGFNPKRYFWEIVIMARKVVVIGIIVFLRESGTLVQVMVALGFVYLSYALHMKAKPYTVPDMQLPTSGPDGVELSEEEVEARKRAYADEVAIGHKLDMLEQASLLTTLLTFFLGYFLNAPNMQESSRLTLMVLIFILNIIFMLQFARAFVQELGRKATKIAKTLQDKKEQRDLAAAKTKAVRLNLRREESTDE